MTDKNVLNEKKERPALERAKERARERAVEERVAIKQAHNEKKERPALERARERVRESVPADTIELSMIEEKIKRHLDICKSLNDMYKAKNKDYGDAVGEIRKEYSNAILIHLTEKLMRLKTLYKSSDKVGLVASETVRDTLLDLANYAIIELIELDINDAIEGGLGYENK